MVTFTEEILNGKLYFLRAVVLAITGVFGGGGGVGSASPPKDEGALNKWVNSLEDGLKRLAGKAAEALPPIIGSAVGAILSFLNKAVGFVSKDTWALIIFTAGLIGA